MPPSDAPRPQ